MKRIQIQNHGGKTPVLQGKLLVNTPCTTVERASSYLPLASKMASSPPEPSGDAPKEKDYRTPGFRGIKTTSLFRAINPELFIKPNKPVMAFGLLTITACVAYIAYLHATEENKKDLYEAIDSEGNRYTRRKTSRWD